jgi:hypothetical protein
MHSKLTRHRLVVAALSLLVFAPAALSWCYITRMPPPGYIPGLQTAPCGQCQCSPFDICPPGKECELVFGVHGARDNCVSANLVVPMQRWTGGSCNSGQNGCCHTTNQSVYLGDSPNTCTIPNDSIGGSYCFLFEPV